MQMMLTNHFTNLLASNSSKHARKTS